MTKFFSILLFLCFTLSSEAQLYFPPNNSNTWDTLAPSQLGWCQDKIDSFYTFLDSNNTKAFILLKDGKIVLEEYFDGHTSSDNWYWASAGKTITALLTGIAQEENFLNINDTSSAYLGNGWTSCIPQQEAKITILNQLTMTSGLDDGVNDPDCTIDSCLQYLTDAGNRWAYHNAPYTLLDQVIENSTGQGFNSYVNQKLKNITGMDGLFLPLGYNNVFFSTARSMARFGLLMLNSANWDGNPVLGDSVYFDAMINTSQSLNLSYGYLWWLNGKSSFMVPQSQFVFNGSLNPNAPNDMFAALGKNGQFINIVPSQNLVWIRMGDSPDNSLVPFTFSDDIWQYLNELNCQPQFLNNYNSSIDEIKIYPNPVKDILHIEFPEHFSAPSFKLIDSYGQLKMTGLLHDNMSMTKLDVGIYFLLISDGKSSRQLKIIKD